MLAASNDGLESAANRLSAGCRHRVALLEAGPEDRYLWIHIPIGYGKTMFHPVYNWGFHTEPEPGMNGRKVYWPRGRGLGGSSSINGLIYVRGQPEDYDAWARAGAAVRSRAAADINTTVLRMVTLETAGKRRAPAGLPRGGRHLQQHPGQPGAAGRQHHQLPPDPDEDLHLSRLSKIL